MEKKKKKEKKREKRKTKGRKQNSNYPTGGKRVGEEDIEYPRNNEKLFSMEAHHRRTTLSMRETVAPCRYYERWCLRWW